VRYQKTIGSNEENGNVIKSTAADDEYLQKPTRKVNELIAKFNSGAVSSSSNNSSNGSPSTYKTDYGVGKVGALSQTRFN